MGRTATWGRRPYSAKDDDTKPSIDHRASLGADVDETKPHFGFFKPRMGTQYQTKVPKWKGPDESISSRPKAELMSIEIPHLTTTEVQEAREERKLESLVVPEQSGDMVSSLSAVVACSPGYGSQQIPRGGLCVHHPDDQMNGFLSFSHPLILSLEEKPVTLGATSSEYWKQQLLRLHNDEDDATHRDNNNHNHSTTPSAPLLPKRGRPSKQRGVKRKLKQESKEEEKKASWELMVTTTTTSFTETAKSPLQLHVAEEDEHVLEYLHLRHNRDVESARVSAMVDLTSGRASKARKCFERQWHKDFARQLPADFPKLWRERYEWSEKASSMCGDLREEYKATYPFRWKESLLTSEDHGASQSNFGLRSRKLDQSSSASSDDEDFKRAWSSVLAFGQTLEQELKVACGEKGGKKPLLSCVLSFIDHVCSLPPPEDVFGNRHVIVDEIAKCMSGVLDHVNDARNMQAKLFDIIYDGKKEGVDITSFSKLLDESDRTIPIQLDEAETWRRSLQIVADWQSQLDAILEKHDEDYDTPSSEGYDLQAAEVLVEQGRTHAIPSKSLVQLEAKIEIAYQLRERIWDWQQIAAEGTKESIKFVAGLVRDANRLKLSFPEVTHLLRVHREAESWVDRANIAIRSRISMSEIRCLIQRASEMPVDLSEYTDKLLSRVRIAEDWLEGFKKVVLGDLASGEEDMLRWMSCMREALNSGKQSVLHEMASEGSRIPVEIDCVKMLQVELDAKNWSLKAKKWIPDGSPGESSTSKRGRLEDLRDHVEKADVLRDKLILSDDQRDLWSLDGEAELKVIVEAADAWFEKYKPFIEGDNRKNNGRSCVSLASLRQIVEDGNSIFANIGSASGKMSKVLSQAEGWYEKHKTLLDRCSKKGTCVTIAELEAAIKEAASDVAIDLDEAVELKNIRAKVEAWFDRSLAAAPKRSKRPTKGRSAKNRYTVAELEELIREARELPVDTTDDIARLEEQLLSVQSWKAQAHQELAEISAAFRNLRDTITAVHGSPAEFSRKRQATDEAIVVMQGSSSNGKADAMDIDDEPAEEKKVGDDSSQTDSASVADSEHENAHMGRIGLGRCNVHKMIASLLKTSKLIGVGTAEEEAATALEGISRWCIKSLKYLDSSKEIFDKRFFGAFDRFLSEGAEFLKLNESGFPIQVEDETLKADLVASCCGVVADQLARLEILRLDRERFVEWCSQAKDILQSGSKISVEMLKDLSDKCQDFPPVTDMLPKIRNLKEKAVHWADSARIRLQGKDKMSMLDAKSLLDEAEKLNITCDESKMLRNAIRNAKGWANRVKRSKLDEGATHIDDVKGLLEEHDSLQIAMPDEATKLRQAMKSYCICRRPYGGFMIGCDTCEEWYHGPCIGLSEARADRCNKYICIRCSTARIYKTSAASIVSLIRKWTNSKERKRARQVEAQKHQRKVRKETKDIEKLQAEIAVLEKWTQERALQNAAGQSNLNANHPVSDVTSGLTSTGTELFTIGYDQSENRQDHLSDFVNADSSKPVVPSRNPECANGNDEEPDAAEMPENAEDAKTKRDKAIASKKMCEDRLLALAQQAALRLTIERKEDVNSESLKRWFVRVRSLVLAPSTEERASLGRPLEDGSLSLPMLQLLSDARKFGICGISDVDTTINAFWCLSWSLRAATVLCGRPNFADMRSLATQSTSISLPDEKALRMMKALIQRAASWQGKVAQALAPKPGETKPICLETLKDLAEEGENIPLKLPEELMLETAIEDKGARHCVCGGPSDGSVMLSCDKCDRWFHGRCMGITKEESDTLSSWICLPCSGEPLPQVVPQQVPALIMDSGSDEEIFSSMTVAKDQPSWPPYGLLGSQGALDALGDCCAIPDDVDDVISSLTDFVSSETTGSASQQSFLVTVSGNSTPPNVSTVTITPGVTPYHQAIDVQSVEQRLKSDPEYVSNESSKGDVSNIGRDEAKPIANSVHSKAITETVTATPLETSGELERAGQPVSPSECCGSVAVSLDTSQSETVSPDANMSCPPTIADHVTGTICEDIPGEKMADPFTESCVGLQELTVKKIASQIFVPPPVESIETNLSADDIPLGPIADMLVECEARHCDAIGTSV